MRNEQENSECIFHSRTTADAIIRSKNFYSKKYLLLLHIFISKIDEDISRIAGAVQSNSATAEESDAISEQLSGQARILSDLISQFDF